MNKVLKNFSVVILAILMLLSMSLFTACGNTQKNDTGNNDNQITQPEQPKPDIPIEPSQPTQPEQPKPDIPIEPNQPTQPEQPTGPYSYRPHLSKDLPVLKINTENGSNDFATKQDGYYVKNDRGTWIFQKQEFSYTNATVSVDNCDTAYQMQNIAAQVKVRGNTTAVYYKKPLRIKFNTKQSMLGLNNDYQAKDWVLLADWKDTSMLRNNLGLYLGQYLFKENGLYASDFRNVELYLNGQYWGVYLLCEQNEIANGRININKAESNYQGTDIGYLIEMDDYAEFEPELNRFWMSFNNRAELTNEKGTNIMSFVKTDYIVKSKIYNEQQKNCISNYLENIYKICYKAIVENKYYKFNDDKTAIVEATEITDMYTAVSNVVDIDSVVATLILQEVVMDADITTSSFFMTVDLSPTGDGKLRFQVPWDFDTAFGWDYETTLGWDGNTITIDKLYAANSNNPWLVLFYKPDFIKEKIKEKWQDLKVNGIQEKLLQYIDDCSNMYKDVYAKNYDRWKNIGSNFKKYYDEMPESLKDNKNYTSSFSIMYWAVPEALQNCNTQAEAASYVKNWLKDRMAALNIIWS